MVLCTKSFLLYYDEKGDDGLFSKNNLYALSHEESAQSFLNNEKIVFINEDDLHGICPSISFTGNKDAWEALALKHFIF
ncbi:hypothetical protein AMTRI_Chr05g60760 [Amborella trichopoda]